MKCEIILSLALCTSGLRLSPTSPQKGANLLSKEGEEYDRNILKYIKKEIAEAFPGMRQDASPSASLQKLNDVKSPQPCGATMIVGFNEKKPTSGFGSKVNNYMNQLAFAAYAHYTVAMWSPSQFDGTWNAFFETTLPVCKHKEEEEYPGIEHGARMFWQELSKKQLTSEKPGAKEEERREYVISMKRETYKAHYKYNQKTADHIEEALKKAELPAKFFGIHIRTGDKSREKTAGTDVSIEAYAKKILEHKDEGIRTVWLATVDPEAEATLQKALGDEYKIKVVSSGDGQWAREPGNTYSEGSDKMYNVLIDVEALRRSTHFIGTASSNMGRLVYFLREPQSSSVSMDEDFLLRAA